MLAWKLIKLEVSTGTILYGSQNADLHTTPTTANAECKKIEHIFCKTETSTNTSILTSTLILSFQVQPVSHTTLLCPQCVLQLQVPPACTPPCQQPVKVDPSHHWCCHHWPPPPPRWPPVMGRSSRQTSLPYGLTPWLGNMGLRSAGREGCRALSCWGRADLALSSR